MRISRPFAKDLIGVSRLGRVASDHPIMLVDEIIGQNGAEIHENTVISVEGCPKAHKATKPHKKAKGKGHKK